MQYTILNLILFVLCVFETESSIDHENHIRSKSNHLVENNKNGVTDNFIEKVIEKINSKHRWKRTVEFDIDADHEEGKGTDVAAQFRLNVVNWKDTRLDVSARYSKHYSDYGPDGKTKIGGSLHFIKN